MCKYQLTVLRSHWGLLSSADACPGWAVKSSNILKIVLFNLITWYKYSKHTNSKINCPLNKMWKSQDLDQVQSRNRFGTHLDSIDFKSCRCFNYLKNGLEKLTIVVWRKFLMCPFKLEEVQKIPGNMTWLIFTVSIKLLSAKIEKGSPCWKDRENMNCLTFFGK